ncbi:BRCT-containing protein 1 [Elsinoe australis]|uniref:BRCT-containing protein 1 n=1 Tax=Elsinoe australis TaxID=40998 RepID=A0A2P7YJ93_9PEZI|nr:BRCT-containing protein 1 [Elsinoe australis]
MTGTAASLRLGLMGPRDPKGRRSSTTCASDDSRSPRRKPSLSCETVEALQDPNALRAELQRLSGTTQETDLAAAQDTQLRPLTPISPVSTPCSPPIRPTVLQHTPLDEVAKSHRSGQQEVSAQEQSVHVSHDASLADNPGPSELPIETTLQAKKSLPPAKEVASRKNTLTEVNSNTSRTSSQSSGWSVERVEDASQQRGENIPIRMRIRRIEPTQSTTEASPTTVTAEPPSSPLRRSAGFGMAGDGASDELADDLVARLRRLNVSSPPRAQHHSHSLDRVPGAASSGSSEISEQQRAESRLQPQSQAPAEETERKDAHQK